MAFGTGTINSLGGAVSDLFGADAHKAKAQGLRIEAANYDLASELATQNEKFTEIRPRSSRRNSTAASIRPSAGSRPTSPARALRHPARRSTCCATAPRKGRSRMR
jgi:hypothetical protein